MASGSGLLKDFRSFIMRGNVLDLAVAVVIGAAFTAVVNSLVNDVLLQLIAAIGGKPNFDGLYFGLNHAQIRYGHFITVVVNFLIVAAAIYVVVRTFEALQNRRRSAQAQAEADEEAPAAPTDEAVLLGEIRDLLAAQAGPHAATAPSAAPRENGQH